MVNLWPLWARLMLVRDGDRTLRHSWTNLWMTFFVTVYINIIYLVLCWTMTISGQNLTLVGAAILTTEGKQIVHIMNETNSAYFWNTIWAYIRCFYWYFLPSKLLNDEEVKIASPVKPRCGIAYLADCGWRTRKPAISYKRPRWKINLPSIKSLSFYPPNTF